MAHVTLWFDCEDYITPLSDAAALWMADLCTDLGIPATFKMVAQKVRVLQRRGRQDVLRALRRHDIGYHTDSHSRHPTVAEYLEGKGWEEGVGEFIRREGQGLEDVKAAFGKPICCYGQPGGSWAPQVYGALLKWGVPLYLDEGGNVGLDAAPFWFCNVLNVFGLQENVCRFNHGDPDDLPRAKQRVADINERLEKQGGGLISIYYHPCEFSTARFWDGVNFAHGQNTDPQDYAIPPLLVPADTERRLWQMREWLSFIKALPNAKFVDGTSLGRLYPDDLRGRKLSAQAVREVAAATAEQINFAAVEGGFLSPAECFALLTRAIAPTARRAQAVFPLAVRSPLGPFEQPPPLAQPFSCRFGALVTACNEAQRHVSAKGALPSAVALAGQQVGPAELLQAAARTLLRPSPPESIQVEPATVATEKHVAPEDADLWGWVIFPPGFRAPQLQRLARLQAWTLKPATLRG